MATVYLAEDLRHHRQVAVKVLRPELAATLGPERFLQEIETAARFQHPHILPLLDSGEAAGFLYYVMPYVEGESLRARLARDGELPIHDAVKILLEVTDALAYAHGRGVVHRDIKPDNVLLSGRHALVTDFGVAKALSEATGRQQLTTAGVALGTPAYMAPEQAAAEPHIDHRVDLYALGAMGYELVAGRPPFTGRSSQEVLAAHMTQRPEPLCARRSACPPGLEAVIMRCLEKRPADRWQTADELLAQLEPLATPSGGTTPTTTRPIDAVVPLPRRPLYRTWLIVAAVLLTLAVAVALGLNRVPPEVRLGRRVQLTLSPGLEIDPALSPDGALVAFIAGPVEQTRLYVRQVDGGAPVDITPQSGFARVPRYSPDGRRLLFRSGRGLEVIPALGGAPRLLVPARVSDWVEAAWSPDGRSILYVADDSIFTRPLESGAAHGLARLAEAHSCVWSPDGRWIACVSGNRTFVLREAFGNIAASSVWVIPAAGGSPIQLTDNQSFNTSPAWLPGDRTLVYVSNRDGGRDLYQIRLTRDGRPAREAARITTGLNAAQVSVSADGRRLAYAAFTESSNIWSLPSPARGSPSVAQPEPVTSGTQIIEDFAISPDGRWLAFDSDRGGNQQIYRLPLAGGEPEQLTAGMEPAFAPDVSPDGREIVYHSFRGGVRQLFVIAADGGTPKQVTRGVENVHSGRWSPDGQTLSFNVGELNTPSQAIKVVSRGTDQAWGSPRLVRRDRTWGIWSPDGLSILMVDPRGRPRRELVVLRGGQERVLVGLRDSTRVLGRGEWSQDGRVIYFLGSEPNSPGVGIWSILATGGEPRLAARITASRTNAIRVHRERLYYTAGDQQSDIWMMEVEGSR
jgi:Tol biopolymer transport system component